MGDTRIVNEFRSEYYRVVAKVTVEVSGSCTTYRVKNPIFKVREDGRREVSESFQTLEEANSAFFEFCLEHSNPPAYRLR